MTQMGSLEMEKPKIKIKSKKRILLNESRKLELLGYLAQQRESKGKKCLVKYINGELIARSEALLAKCADCSAYYTDGMKDCEVPGCPLYPWMPYRKNKNETL